jgi:putative transposase
VTCHLFKGALFLGRDGRGALIAAARYMAMNPVTARLVERAEHWPWSSVRAHLIGRNDRLVEVAPALSRCGGRFADLVAEEADAALVAALRAAETFGRPLAPPSFLDRLAALAGRDRSRESAAASRGSPRRPLADGPDASLLQKRPTFS